MQAPATVTPAQLARRVDRYRSLWALWRISSLKRVRGCSLWRINSGVGVPICNNGERSYFSNVQRCASIWGCPVCSAKIRDGRTDEIRRANKTWYGSGGKACMLTLTVRHSDGQRLAPMLDAVAGGFTELLTGAAWAGRWRHTRNDQAPTEWSYVAVRMVEDRRKNAPLGAMRPQWLQAGMKHKAGVIGTIRAAEVTHGENGWHPHLHVLVYVEGGDNWEARCTALGEDLEARWCDYIEARGYARPLEGMAANVRLLRTADDAVEYIAKVQDNDQADKLAMELTRSDLKTGRRHGRTPFQILRDVREAASLEEGDDLALWWEYEQATHGRKAITWSRGLKDRLLIDEVSDEDLAEAEVGGEPRAVVPIDTWRRLCARRDGVSAVLRADELGGPEAVRSTLEALGLPARLEPPPPRPD
jgi:hypothetical protein